MTSRAETGKDGPIAHTAAAAVVLRHRAAAAACACLTVDAAAAAYCTPEGFLLNHYQNSRGFTKGFF